MSCKAVTASGPATRGKRTKTAATTAQPPSKVPTVFAADKHGPKGSDTQKTRKGAAAGGQAAELRKIDAQMRTLRQAISAYNDDIVELQPQIDEAEEQMAKGGPDADLQMLNSMHDDMDGCKVCIFQFTLDMQLYLLARSREYICTHVCMFMHACFSTLCLASCRHTSRRHVLLAHKMKPVANLSLALF